MNDPLLRKIQKFILEKPKRMFMGCWIADDVTIDAYGLIEPDCGTVACIGGLAQILSRSRKKGGQELLQLDEDQANSLFFVSAWPDQFRLPLFRCKRQSFAYAQVVSDRIDRFIETKGRE